MRARVDVDLSGVRDELGGVVKLRGVEQLLRFGQRGLVEPLHAFHNLRRGGRSVEGKVDVHVAAVSRLGCQANKLDFEVFEALEAELFAKTVHACDRNVGACGKFLNRKHADVLADGKGCNAELLLGGGEALRLGNLAFDIHANSHTRQACQKGTGLFWHVSVGIRKCQGRGGGPWARKELSGLARPLLSVPCAGDTRLIDPRCKGDAHPTSTTGKGSRLVDFRSQPNTLSK